jgi:Ca-activated chloride channel family protein
MKKTTLISLFLAAMMVAWGQDERKVIRQGLKAYNKGDYSEAEVQFRKAEDLNEESFEADFNTGTALYGQEKFEETARQYESLAKESAANLDDDPETLAHTWHNLGNSLLKAQQYAQSIEAYKNSLRLNPDDFDSKYNLAYARQMLKEQQQQQQQQQNQDPKDSQDQNQGDQQKEEEPQPQDQQQQPADQQQQPADQQQEPQDEQSQKPRPREISKEDAERMLEAIQQQEKEVKEKVDREKAAAVKVKTKKDW